MYAKHLAAIIGMLSPFLTGAGSSHYHTRQNADNVISCIIDPSRQQVQLYWKNDSGDRLGSIGRLKDYLTSKHKRLVFAMNGGMFKPDHSPLGLFIEDGRRITPLDTAAGPGNFYLKPNGVVFITQGNKSGICRTEAFADSGQIRFATQSGPMLLTGGSIHPAFQKGSPNVNIRNGVGLLPGNRLLFAMSTTPINFYDFALFFEANGCTDALYLDGLVSRTYLPAKHWEQLDGDFGVIIGVEVPN